MFQFPHINPIYKGIPLYKNSTLYILNDFIVNIALKHVSLTIYRLMCFNSIW